MNVDWLPNDENAPLPLSSSYRANLRKLCTLLSSGKELHPNLQQKKKILKKMCAKLERDDNNVAAAQTEGQLKKLGYGAVAIVSLGLLFANGEDIAYNAKKTWRRWFGKKSRGYFVRGGATPNDEDEGQILASLLRSQVDGGVDKKKAAEANILELRKARLSRFADTSATAASD